MTHPNENGRMKHFDDNLFWLFFFFFSYSSLLSILCSVLDILVVAFDLYETKRRIKALACLYTRVLCRMFNWTEEIDYSNGRRPLTFSSILSFNQFIWQAFTVSIVYNFWFRCRFISLHTVRTQIISTIDSSTCSTLEFSIKIDPKSKDSLKNDINSSSDHFKCCSLLISVSDECSPTHRTLFYTLFIVVVC